MSAKALETDVIDGGLQISPTQRVYYGIYTCRHCKKRYTVNDGTWRRCTPEVCHDCLETYS